MIVSIKQNGTKIQSVSLDSQYMDTIEAKHSRHTFGWRHMGIKTFQLIGHSAVSPIVIKSTNQESTKLFITFSLWWKPPRNQPVMLKVSTSWRHYEQWRPKEHQ